VTLSRSRDLIQYALGLPQFLRNPVTVENAEKALKKRLENRRKNFLKVLASCVYSNPDSPYHRLLKHSGFSFDDIEKRVCAKGIENTLLALREADVFIRLEEFKAQKPVTRDMFYLFTRESDFNNQSASRPGLRGRTSGTRSKGTRVFYNWDFLTQEAQNECFMYHAHDVLQSPVALWYPFHLSIAGIHNILLNLKHSHSPERWFTQTRHKEMPAVFKYVFVAACAQNRGLKVPAAEHAPMDDSYSVSRWLAETCNNHSSAVLRTFTSSAVRAVETALENGLDISGSTIFTGGEPLTQRHSEFMKSAGVSVYTRYISTETGLIAGPCSSPACADDVHLYTDRLALIRDPEDGSFLYTTLLPSSGKILLNTSIGDTGDINHYDCGCPLGRIGFHIHLSGVSSTDKLTMGGMSVFIDELDSAVSGMISSLGGSPAHYQFRQHTDPDTDLRMMSIVVDPAVQGIDESAFIPEVLKRLRSINLRVEMASDIWEQARSMRLVREKPQITKGQKQLLLVNDGPTP